MGEQIEMCKIIFGIILLLSAIDIVLVASCIKVAGIADEKIERIF